MAQGKRLYKSAYLVHFDTRQRERHCYPTAIRPNLATNDAFMPMRSIALLEHSLSNPDPSYIFTFGELRGSKDKTVSRSVKR